MKIERKEMVLLNAQECLACEQVLTILESIEAQSEQFDSAAQNLCNELTNFLHDATDYYEDD